MVRGDRRGLTTMPLRMSDDAAARRDAMIWAVRVPVALMAVPVGRSRGDLPFMLPVAALKPCAAGQTGR